MELSVAIQAKVEVTPSNWNFGFQPTVFYAFSRLLSGFNQGPVYFPFRNAAILCNQLHGLLVIRPL